MAIAYSRAAGRRYEGAGAAESVVDDIAVEEPLEVRVGRGSAVHRSVVLMRTPGHDLELAVGWLRGEGVVREQSDVRSVRGCADRALTPERRRNTVLVDLSESAVERLAGISRSTDVSGACGVCGADSLERVMAYAPATSAAPAVSVDRAIALGLTERLATVQGGFARTGGLHGAAVADSEGRLLSTREDIGRHNAVDKVLGWSLLEGAHPTALVVSSRASFEIVQKAASAGVPVVVTVSAPSSLAIDLAQRAGITLLAFARPGRATAYAHPERIV